MSEVLPVLWPLLSLRTQHTVIGEREEEADTFMAGASVLFANSHCISTSGGNRIHKYYRDEVAVRHICPSVGMILVSVSPRTLTKVKLSLNKW